jgi:hypothetical protein
MGRFEWEGRTYNFDALACYNGSGLISLPDGRILSVVLWFETAPPMPVQIRDLGMPTSIESAFAAGCVAVGAELVDRPACDLKGGIGA